MPNPKSDFVRTMPNASVQEVVAAAAKAGIKLDTTYVAKTRGLDKARLARWGKPGARAAAKTTTAPKRGPGRPKKVAVAAAPAPAKRGPGRPKKAQTAASPAGDGALRSAVARYAAQNGIAAARAEFEAGIAKLLAFIG